VLLFLLVFSFVVAGNSPVLGVPAAPNQTLLTAQVVEQEIVDSTILKIEPKQVLYRYKLRIIKTESFQESVDFLAGHEGGVIEVLSKEAPPIAGLVGKTIKARVSFRGDEKNGRYWLVEFMGVNRD
jgi:hypothetical protein